MTFRLAPVLDPHLPRLAWCARVRRGGEVVVRHGSDVEVAVDAVFEGAWDGVFSDAAFDRAPSFAGTGVRVREGALRFVSGSGRHDRLYATRRDGDLFVSNSLAFALIASGDEPDPRRSDYIATLVRQVLTSRYERTPHELQGRRGPIALYELRDFVVDGALACHLVEKESLPEPRDYAEVIAALSAVIARTFSNAADPARRKRYSPLATISRGYDSPATSLLAARNGCTECLTFGDIAPGRLSPDDGTPIAAHLGLIVRRRMRDAWRQRTDLPEAELWACPPPLMMPLASVEADLAGRVVVTGRYGDRLFPSPDGPGRPATMSILAAPSSSELRLRVGFIQFAPFFALRSHAAALDVISRSDALRPWRVGGSYDRPVLRRLLEEAGVPRELFGQAKFTGAMLDLRKAADLSPTSQRDFAAFLAARPDLPTGFDLPLRLFANRGLRIARRLAMPIVRRLSLPHPPYPVAWPTRYDERMFHWGFARIRDRYLGHTP